AELDGIDQGQLSAEGKVNYAVYRAQTLDLVDAVNQRTYQMPFNADSSFWSSLGFMAQRRLTDVQQAEEYIAVLEDVPRHFDQQITNMRAGLARGFSVPRALLEGLEDSIAMVAQPKGPAASPRHTPCTRLPAGIPAARQARLPARARAAIGEQVVPAFANLLTFFNTKYVP